MPCLKKSPFIEVINMFSYCKFPVVWDPYVYHKLIKQL